MSAEPCNSQALTPNPQAGKQNPQNLNSSLWDVWNLRSPGTTYTGLQPGYNRVIEGFWKSAQTTVPQNRPCACSAASEVLARLVGIPHSQGVARLSECEL